MSSKQERRGAFERFRPLYRAGQLRNFGQFGLVEFWQNDLAYYENILKSVPPGESNLKGNTENDIRRLRSEAKWLGLPVESLCLSEAVSFHNYQAELKNQQEWQEYYRRKNIGDWCKVIGVVFLLAVGAVAVATFEGVPALLEVLGSIVIASIIWRVIAALEEIARNTRKRDDK